MTCQIQKLLLVVLISRNINFSRGSCEECSTGGVYLLGSCYFFEMNPVEFSSAELSCNVLGYHLVYINSQEEQTAIESAASIAVPDSDFWIGLTKNVDGDIIWLDQSSTAYRKVSDSSSFDDGTTCFRMKHDSSYRWHDASCVALYGYICEYINPSCSTESFDGLCYFISSVPTNHDDAVTSCASLFGNLVYIETEEEQDFLVSRITSYSPTADFWIGLTLTSDGYDQIWGSGATLNFEYFDQYSSFNENTPCFRMKAAWDYQWHDAYCSSLFPFICEGNSACSSSEGSSESTSSTSSSGEQSSSAAGSTSRQGSDPDPVSTVSEQWPEVTSTGSPVSLPLPPSAQTTAGETPIRMRTSLARALPGDKVLPEALVFARSQRPSVIRCAEFCDSQTSCTHFTFSRDSSTCALANAVDITSGDFGFELGARSFVRV